MDNGHARGHKRTADEVEGPVIPSHHEIGNAISSCRHSHIHRNHPMNWTFGHALIKGPQVVTAHNYRMPKVSHATDLDLSWSHRY